MFLIGENLNVINRVIGKAFKEKDPRPIAEEAIRQKEKGVDWIDINLGPARKGGPELMAVCGKDRAGGHRRQPAPVPRHLQHRGHGSGTFAAQRKGHHQLHHVQAGAI